jgi:hypothetical protein
MPSDRYVIERSDMVVRDVDVLVLGAGIAGVFAAASAKSPDNSVVIVEPSNILGGQGTTGGVAGFCGDTARVNRLFEELVADLERCGKIDPYRPNDDRRAYDLESCGFYLQELLLRRDVEIWLHARAIDAKVRDGSVSEVLVLIGPTLVKVRPTVVIDATGNAMIPEMVGLETVHLGALKQLPMSLYFTLWDTGRPVVPYLPHGCPEWQSDDDLPMTSLHAFADGRIEVKMKVVGFDAADGISLSKAEIFARRQMMGLVYYLQTKGYRGRHAAMSGRPLETYTLASVSRSIGQREGRRIVGETVLLEHEVRSAAEFDDAVAVGTYHLDFHWPDTDRRAGTGVTDMVEPYHIPLKAFIPRGLKNVLCPGRSLSGEQMAMSSYRVMATCAQMGFGAGKAAELSVERSVPVGELDPAELRDRIEKGGQSLDLSYYGEYLRCLQNIHQPVGLPSYGSAPNQGGLALLRRGGARTYCFGLDGLSRLSVSLRHRTVWKFVGALELPADIAELQSCEADAEGITIRHVTSAGRIRTARAKIPMDHESVVDWTVHESEDNRGPVAEPLLDLKRALRAPDLRQSPLFFAFDGEGRVSAIRDAIPSDQSRALEWTRASRVFDFPGEGESVVSLCLVARGEAHSVNLFAILSADGGRTFDRYLPMAESVEPSVPPALIRTRIGFAVAYRRADGQTWYWEGSVERFGAVGKPAPSEAELKRMPYQDHILLEARLRNAHDV